LNALKYSTFNNDDKITIHLDVQGSLKGGLRRLCINNSSDLEEIPRRSLECKGITFIKTVFEKVLGLHPLPNHDYVWWEGKRAHNIEGIR
jgi:hypothetical protein